MAKLTRVSEVSVYTRNAKLAREFYTRKVGLVVRTEMKKLDYLQLGTTKGGEDAGIDLWKPDPSWGREMYESTSKSVGIVTGIGFLTTNLEKTVEQLSSRGVKVETEGEGMARIRDPDGNVLFLQQHPKPKVRRAGLQSVGWVTVVSRDAEKAGRWFKSLGFRGMKVPGGEGMEEPFSVYHLGPKGTSIMPFTPARGMYDNPADYEEDMAHVGEDTGIGTEVEDIYGLQKKLLAKGVRFDAKAEKQSWGGIRARILDPDGNRYMIYEMA